MENTTTQKDNENLWVMIRVNGKTWGILKNMKQRPSETFDEIINKLLTKKVSEKKDSFLVEKKTTVPVDISFHTKQKEVKK